MSKVAAFCGREGQNWSFSTSVMLREALVCGCLGVQTVGLSRKGGGIKGCYFFSEIGLSEGLGNGKVWAPGTADSPARNLPQSPSPDILLFAPWEVCVGWVA